MFCLQEISTLRVRLEELLLFAFRKKNILKKLKVPCNFLDFKQTIFSESDVYIM